MIDRNKILNNICLSKPNQKNVFNANKCLTYIDEFDQKINENKNATSLVSLTFFMDHYIEDIEKKWIQNVRIKYGFKMGEPIHFTKVRRISQTVKYTDKDGKFQSSVGWNDEYINYRANSLIDFEKEQFKNNISFKSQKNFIEEYKVWNLFRKVNDNGVGILDTDKLISFYKDIFSIIREAKFNILCTTILYNTSAYHKKIVIPEQVKSPYAIAFGEHLDLLCFYLRNGFKIQENKNLSTKLRWDGDDGFNPRSDYRLLFNKVISLGTTHFQSETVRKCLDEIRFVNKSEIGYFDNLDNQTIVSHIGCDMADFIAYFIGRESMKTHIIDTYQTKDTSLREIEFENSVSFKIGDEIFSPYKDILKDKILKTSAYSSIQIFNECHYSI